MLGESIGFRPSGKESWSWNESVQSKARVKRIVLKFGLGVKMLKHGEST